MSLHRRDHGGDGRGHVGGHDEDQRHQPYYRRGGGQDCRHIRKQGSWTGAGAKQAGRPGLLPALVHGILCHFRSTVIEHEQIHLKVRRHD